jgi:hypothetical protein
MTCGHVHFGPVELQLIPEDFLGLLGPEGPQFFPKIGAMGGENGDGQQRGIDGSSLADGERADGYSAGHLNDRKKRIEPFEGVALDGNAEDGQDGVRGDHSGKMRGSSGGGDDHFEAALLRGRGVLGHEVRRAMGRDDFGFVRHAELREHVARVAHRLSIGFAAHDDADEGTRVHESIGPGRA